MTGLYQSLYVWNDLAGTGSATGIITSIFLPFRVLIAGLSLTGLPLGVLQRIIDVVFFAAAGWGMYYFVTSVFSFEDDSKRRIAAVSSAIPYMFNLFIPYWLLIGAFPEYPLVALPYLVAFLYKGIRSDRARDWLKYAVLLGVSLSFLATSPEFFIIVVFALAPLVLYIVISGLKAGRRRQVVSGLKFLAVGSLVSIGMNSYWLVVNAFSIFQFNSIGAAVSQSPGLQRVLSFFDAPNVVVQSYRTVAWIVPLNAPVTPLNFWVLDPSWMALGLVLAATSFLALLFRPREK